MHGRPRGTLGVRAPLRRKSNGDWASKTTHLMSTQRPSTFFRRRELAAAAWRVALLCLLAGTLLGCRHARLSEDQARAEMQRRAPGEHQLNTPAEVAADLRCSRRTAAYARFDHGEVLPVRTGAGQEINYRLVYAACPGFEPQLVGILTRRIAFGREIRLEEKDKFTLKPGRWAIDVFIGVPSQSAPGRYRLEALFESAGLSLRDRQEFEVIPSAVR